MTAAAGALTAAAGALTAAAGALAAAAAGMVMDGILREPALTTGMSVPISKSSKEKEKPSLIMPWMELSYSPSGAAAILA